MSRLATILCLALASGHTAAAFSQPATSSAVPIIRGDWTADTRATWRGDDGEARVQMNLRSTAGDNRWGFGVRPSELDGLPAAAMSGGATNVQFSWTREAGVFRFSGSFDAGRGAGTCTFTSSAAFVSGMAGLGYRSLSADDVLRLALHDVTHAFVRGLGQAGYGSLLLDDLVRMKIHQVTPEGIGELAALGYTHVPADDLIRLSIHGATPAEIGALQALGFRGMAVEDLIRFRIHKVTPEFVVSMREVGYVAVSEEQLIRLRIHNVDAQFVRDGRADGYALQSPADAIELAIHGPRLRRRR